MMDVLALISGEYAGLGSLVVIYSINPGITSFSLSPTTTYIDIKLQSKILIIKSCFEKEKESLILLFQ